MRLEDKVAIISGAASGMGAATARRFAKEGAKVVVADMLDDDGRKVAADIVAANGAGIFMALDVTSEADWKRVVDDTVALYGRLDILVNNAGVLRDKAFNNMDLADYEFVNQVHHFGTVYCTKAAWPIMRKQQYGRIVVTTSGSGTVGNFGQSNYGAAKMAVNGLINVLRFEGAKYNIRINAISPSALTRMTESLLPPDIAPYMKPELVSPAVAWLCSEECDQNGEIIAATAGGYARVQYFVTEGVQFDPEQSVTIEMIAESIDEIRDLSTAFPYTGLMGNVAEKLREMGRIK
jgi:NAD(P)-dependent dehydrogenase (short-subunit alcohol dehydrogenase family)